MTSNENIDVNKIYGILHDLYVTKLLPLIIQNLFDSPDTVDMLQRIKDISSEITKDFITISTIESFSKAGPGFLSSKLNLINRVLKNIVELQYYSLFIAAKELPPDQVKEIFDSLYNNK